MTERVVVLTGATDGLGRALAGRLATEPGTRLILHGRSVDRLAALRAELVGQPARVETVQADMAELVQVRRLADDIVAVTGTAVSAPTASPSSLSSLTASPLRIGSTPRRSR